MSTRLSTEELDAARIEAALRAFWSRREMLQQEHATSKWGLGGEAKRDALEAMSAALAAADAISEPAARRALRDLTAQNEKLAASLRWVIDAWGRFVENDEMEQMVYALDCARAVRLPELESETP